MTAIQQLLAQLDLVGFHPFRAITLNPAHWQAVQAEHRAATSPTTANTEAADDIAMIGGVPTFPLEKQKTAWLLFTDARDVARHIAACGEAEKWLLLTEPRHKTRTP